LKEFASNDESWVLETLLLPARLYTCTPKIGSNAMTDVGVLLLLLAVSVLENTVVPVTVEDDDEADDSEDEDEASAGALDDVHREVWPVRSSSPKKNTGPTSRDRGPRGAAGGATKLGFAAVPRGDNEDGTKFTVASAVMMGGGRRHL
jgi:hypothetical protein